MHQYKNLNISLPANWRYELEEGDIEACFDPRSTSTLRVHIMKVVSNDDKNSEESIRALTSNCEYEYTKKWHLLTKPLYTEAVENGKDVTLITWRLIHNERTEKIVAILTYTVLSSEKNSSTEQAVLRMIESSLREAELNF